MQSKSTIDNHREISAALDFLRQASADDGALELDPRVVSGWVEMCLGALEVLVTAKRGKHADDKALKQTVEEHLDHASGHAAAAYNAAHGDNVDSWTWCSGVDDDGLMHFDHATARIALLYARKAIVEREKEDTVALFANGRRCSVTCNREIRIGDPIYQRDIDPCHGCSYAKWPNKGPGYSVRCDKCKLDPNRPGYMGK